MDPAHVVLLIAVTITVVAIAGYLIAIALILKHVVNQLVTILGAVDAVTETAQPVGAVIDDINRDLDAGRKLIEASVARLEDSRVPVGMTAAEPDRHAADEYGSAERSEGAVAAPSLPAPASTGTEPAEPRSRTGGRGWWNR
jgi:hypothetical protein